MIELAGRTAVVVGGGSGIGRGTALGLAGEGMHVVVADIETASAEAVVAEIEAAGGSAVAEQVDGTSRESLAALAERTVARTGAVHVLSNNVGVVTNRALDVATEADWGWVIEFNLLSIVRSVDVFLPHLRAHGGPAHIVNTASMAALLALPPKLVGGTHLGLYTATKHAVLGYSEILRGELEPEGIGVSVFCPGTVASNLGATSARNRPERWGGPGDPVPGGSIPGAMPAEDIGRYVVAGIRGNRLHILTHPARWDMVAARQQRVKDDFDFFAALDAELEAGD